MNVTETRLKISDIRTDGGTQPRAFIHPDTVADYADAMTDGASFPSVVVFYDGNAYWLADGFHRVQAAVKCGWLDIDADVRQGTCRDAVLYSVGANATHGMRRTNADKRRAVEVLLRDEEWGKWSAEDVADQCGVSANLVKTMRRESPDFKSSEVAYTTKHGTTATMQTQNIGKRTSGGDSEPVAATVPDEEPTSAAPVTRKPAAIAYPPASAMEDEAFAIGMNAIVARFAQIAGFNLDDNACKVLHNVLLEARREGRITIK